MPPAIRVENLSKAYQLGEIGTGTISRDLERWLARIRGKEDPFLRIGEKRNQEKNGLFWSLKDISFEIEQGDTVGIIGRNGAGKSTLLKILSRVTTPTSGKITGRGRVASLLEVGTGFHPELTGRENIFLNGAILGMRKKEIKRKFDEIVDFAGVERYIDTPVKRYSSGMYVRLAFAVAAHLEAEILIVDEVLAVGDAEFQKKCLGKMSEVSKGEGRTVLFVSHNMESILNLCTTSILLHNGFLINYNKTHQVVSNYIKDGSTNTKYIKKITPAKKIQLVQAEVDRGNDANSIMLKTVIVSTINQSCSIDIRISDHLNSPVGFGSIGGLDSNEMVNIISGENLYHIKINIKNLALGIYTIHIDITKPNIEYFDRVHDCLQFEIIKNNQSIEKRYMSQTWNYGSYNLPVTLVPSQCLIK